MIRIILEYVKEITKGHGCLVSFLAILVLWGGGKLVVNLISGVRDWKSEVESHIVVKNEAGVKFRSYQEACNAEDFESAHTYIAKMRNVKRFTNHEIDEAEQYVFRLEALYLMGQGTEFSRQRIIYLLKQYPSDANCSMLIELAIDFDDIDFAKSLTKHYVEQIPSNISRRIVEYLYIEGNGREEDIDFVSTLLNHNNQMDILLLAAIEKEDMALAKKLAKNGRMSFPGLEKVAPLLLRLNDPDFENLIAVCIEQNLPSGTIPVLGKTYRLRESYEPVIEYINELTLYNTNCHKMLDLAIQYKNRRLAEMIVASVKPSYRYWNYISSSSCITIYDFSSNSAIDEAKKKLEEAIAAGLI